MSTAPNNTLTQSLNTVLSIAIAGIFAAEATTANGPDKKQAVLQTVLAGLQGGAKAGEQSDNSTIIQVSTIIDAAVSVFNSLGVIQHGSK